MRRLLLLRHAKSDWPDGVADHERPLARRGKEAAPRMGAYLAHQHLAPDLALVSTAKRARETWDLASKVFPKEVPVRLDGGLYEAAPDDILAVIGRVEPSVRTLIVVGHNPGFEELATLLVGHGDRFAYSRLVQKYPTAALAVIDFPHNETWDDLEPRSGRLDRFVTPRMIGGEED